MSDDQLITHYSAALDEIYRLRTALAYEALVLEAHLDLASFPKSRRRYAEDQVQRMRAAATGDAFQAYYDTSDLSLKTARREVGMPGTLTRSQWEADQ